jgi:hypothetical protein
LEGEERRKAAKTVGFPFFGRELYEEITFSDTFCPKFVPYEEAIAISNTTECATEQTIVSEEEREVRGYTIILR